MSTDTKWHLAACPFRQDSPMSKPLCDLVSRADSRACPLHTPAAQLPESFLTLSSFLSYCVSHAYWSPCFLEMLLFLCLCTEDTVAVPGSITFSCCPLWDLRNCQGELLLVFLFYIYLGLYLNSVLGYSYLIISIFLLLYISIEWHFWGSSTFL